MGRALTVVVLDDDEVDREAARRALRHLPLAVAEVGNGDDALALLRSGSLEAPLIVLVDINMPGLDGFGFLDALRADAELGLTLAFVLTSSSRQVDVRAAYERNVAGYLVKGELGARLEHLSSLLEGYLAAVELPSSD